MFAISPERPEDGPAIEILLDRVFGPDRHAKTSYRYRDGLPPLADLARTVFEGAGLVGAIRFWPIRIEAAPALLLGPLGVDPARQGRGIGRALIEAGLERARRNGHRVCLLVGDPVYYAARGFEPAAPHGIVMPKEDPGRLMVRALVPSALDGIAGRVGRIDGAPACALEKHAALRA